MNNNKGHIMTMKNQIYHSIIDYCNIILKNPQNVSCIEYLFNILKQIGLICMSQGKIDDKLLNSVKKLFYNKLPTSDTHAPSFINFADLNQEADQFINISMENHPRVPMHDAEAILWEEKSENVIELGMRLIENGLMIKAVSQGEDILGLSDCKSGEKVSNAWSKSWQKFEEKSVPFINKLINRKNIENFFILSDDVLSLLAEYAFIPEDKFQKFLYNIAAPQKKYAENHNYRKLVTADEAKELFEQVKKKYQNNLNVSLAYTFEAAMAQKAVKNFILNNCSLLESTDDSKYGKLLTNLDMDTGSETPFIIAGNKLFTNHIIISDGFLSGWGVRKDDDAIKSLNQPESDFSGALFCSLKQYPNGAWTISFDSYKNKEQFYKLIEQGDEYFVRLPYEQIFDEDKREEFLQEAAMAVMGLEKKPDWLPEFLKKLFFAPGNGLDKIAKAIRKFPGILEPEFKDAFAPAQSMSGGHEDNYYIPVKSLENTSFLDPECSNESVAKSVNRGFGNEWQYIYLFVDTKANIIDEVHGPLEMSGEGEEISDIPDDAECVWFFIGTSPTLKKIKTEYAKKKTLAITKQEKLYWIIYGPED